MVVDLFCPPEISIVNLRYIFNYSNRFSLLSVGCLKKICIFLNHSKLVYEYFAVENAIKNKTKTRLRRKNYPFSIYDLFSKNNNKKKAGSLRSHINYLWNYNRQRKLFFVQLIYRQQSWHLSEYIILINHWVFFLSKSAWWTEMGPPGHHHPPYNANPIPSQLTSQIKYY